MPLKPTPEEVAAMQKPDIRIDLLAVPVYQARCQTCGWVSEHTTDRAKAEASGRMHARVAHEAT